MKKVHLVLLLVAAGILLGCRQNGVSADPNGDPEPVRYDNFTFYSSKTLYDELQNNRSDNAGISFEIADVWKSSEHDRLYLHVAIKYRKVCDDQFEVVWDGRIAESYPLQIYLFVRLDAEGCRNLDEMTTDTLTLDVYEVISPEANPSVDDAIFRVSNASSDQDVSSDEPVAGS